MAKSTKSRKRQRQVEPRRTTPRIAPRLGGDEATERQAPRTWVLNGEQIRAACAFVAIAIVGFGFYYFPRDVSDPIEIAAHRYLHTYAQVAWLPIRAFDSQAVCSGTVISGRFAMNIVKSCDAMEANILFVAAVLAFPAVWRRKAVALVVGLGSLVAFNIVRLFALYWVGVFAPGAFEAMHFDVFPLLTIAFATLDFIVCIQWLSSADAELHCAGV